MTISQARAQLLRIADRFDREPTELVEVTRHGKPVMRLMSASTYDTLIETLEILADPATMARLRKALRELDAGKGIPWRAVRSGLRG